MQKPTESISESSKIEVKACHWCKNELQGLLAEFVHCAVCNERRLSEGLDKTFDPCPVCMTLKSERWNFLNPDNKMGNISHD